MKLHLNLSLRRALLAAMATVCTLCSAAYAGGMHDDTPLQTYTDFGQNRGRYVVGSQVNSLLEYIRSEEVENGIRINYTDGTYYTISADQGMISYRGTHDGGHSVAVGANIIATVEHNGSIDASFSERWVGNSNAINYASIDIRGSDIFRLVPHTNGWKYDYMLQRQSKIITDTTWNPVTTLTTTEIENLDGTVLYHSGAGSQAMWIEDEDRMQSLTGAYVYIIGAINEITNGQIHSGTSYISLHQQPNYGDGVGASEDNPLPNGPRAGDSGSPTFIYNTTTGQYEYIASQQSAGGNSYGQARGDAEWTYDTMEQFNAHVDLAGTTTVYLNAIDKEGDFIDDNNGNSTQIYYGEASSDAAGQNVIASYKGIQTGVSTWSDLSGIKDNDNWYAYGNGYLTQKDTDLFFNENLVFTAPTSDNYTIVLNDTVDLGIGYVEFNKGEGDLKKSVFTITSAEGENNLLNSAGYVINEGAEVHVRLNNPDTHMYEWRKNGAGDLYIDGTGNTNVLLTVGGSGTTYLQQTGGYAAYNVLASSGATVVIRDLNQIERDFTFGSGGGTLDMNGNSMEWHTSTDAEGRFTIHALTEEAMITNSSQAAVTLTYVESGNQTYKGSFTDQAGAGALNITYAGGGTWNLNSIHTDLAHTGQSTFTVSNGKVVLTGTNTVHGMGSATGTNANRLTVKNDWHYADANLNYVEVANGAALELGSHARLKGDIWLQGTDSTLILREGVHDRYEYVEGGAVLEDTYRYAVYYGLHNSTIVANTGSHIKVEYSVDTTANTTLDETVTISGKGALSVNAGTSGGSLTLLGNHSGHSGTKTLLSGGLIAGSNESLGNTSTNKWVLQETAWLASHGFTDEVDILSHIDASSTGTLALSNALVKQLEGLASTHSGLTLGAEAGKTVQYGASGTSEELLAVNGEWKLGGGGGELVVNFLLSGENNLILGNHSSSTGTVTLANENNSFSGDIIFNSTGITLNASEKALGDAKVALNYSNTLALGSVSNTGIIKEGSTGILAITQSSDLDMSSLDLTLGALGSVEFSGHLTAGIDGIHRLGGSGNLILTATDSFSSKQIYIDGQGLSGSSVTFARANAFDGSIVAGGGLRLDSANSQGDVSILIGHRDSLASTSSILLQKGAALDIGNLAQATIQNLSIESGGQLLNDGESYGTVTLNVSADTTTNIVSSALSGNNIHLMKTGDGKMVVSSTKNESWIGGLTIKEGTVEAYIHSDNWTNYGGIGSSSNVVTVEKGATFKLNAETRYGFNLTGTSLPQTVIGSGTIELASGGAVLFNNQKSAFDGTIKISGGTRLYVGSSLKMNGGTITYNSLNAVNGTTVEVESGSQIRITSSLQYLTETYVTTDADFVISGQGYTGGDTSQGNSLYQANSTLRGGALSIDTASIVTGNITLADDASIASWSAGKVVDSIIAAVATNGYVSYYACGTNGNEAYNSYALKGHLGGTVRGRILGEGKDLTLLGNETLTFTADSANTYRNLIISNGNGNEDDKVALKLDAGDKRSQVSTALGTGTVTINDSLILRLAGTGVADDTDVVYTYENAMRVGAGSTLQSYNITNKLTDVVTMTGDSLNLATANGGVLQLAGGLQGRGTLNVAAGSRVILGSAAVSRAAAPQFSGNVAAGAAADITMASPAVVAAETTFSGTDSLTLRLGGTDDFTLGGITVSDTNTEDETGSALTLHFDFTHAPDSADASTWSMLTVTNGISADSTIIALELNINSDIASGSYALISGVDSTTGYSLADTLNDRLGLTIENGNLVLVVDADGRYYWRSEGAASTVWNATDANWYRQSQGDALTTYSLGGYVVFDVSGLAAGAERGNVELGESVSVDTIAIKDADYTISGTGSVEGNSMIVANGADAVLNLSGAGNSFTQGITVDNARLEWQDSAVATAAKVQNKGTLALTGGSNLTGNVAVTSGAHFTADASTLSGDLTIHEADATLSNRSTVAGQVVVQDKGHITIANSTVQGLFSGVGVGAASLSGATFSGGLEFAELKNKFTLSAAVTGTLSWDPTTGVLTLDSLTTSGNLSTTQDSSSAGEMIFLGTSSIGRYEGKMGTTTIGLDAEHKAFLTVESAEFSDNDNKGAVTINVNEGAIFKVTSTGTQVDSGANYASNGLRLSEWNSSSTLNVAGAVLAANSSLHLGDKTSYVNIASTGILAIQGIRNGRTNGTSGLNLTMEKGGNLVIGRENVSTGGAFTATLNGGTVASSADETSIYGNLTINGDVTFDTARYAFATDGNSIARGTEESHITLRGTLSGEGHITLDGSGTLSLENSISSFSGSVAVQGGATLKVSKDSAGLWAGMTSLTIAQGALDISAYDFNAETPDSISLASETSYHFSENATVILGDMQEEAWYSLFDTSAYGASLTGWEALGVQNFRVGGVALADKGRVSLSLSNTGGVFYYSVEHYDLVWNGGESGTWNRAEENKSWQYTAPESEAATDMHFVTGDNVRFLGEAAVTLGQDIAAGAVTLQKADEAAADFTVSLDESAGKLSAESIHVGEGVTLSFATEKDGYTAANISGAGTVELTLSGSGTGGNDSSGWSNKLQLGDSFAGETYVKGGNFDLTGASVGSTLRLADGVNANSSGSTSLNANIVLEGTTYIHANSNSPIMYNGMLSGKNADFRSAGGSSHTFNDIVDIKNFQTEGAATVNFKGRTDIETTTINQATVNFNGNTDITTATISGGTTSFNGSTQIGTANFNGGTVNFATDSLSIDTFNRGAGNVNFRLAAGTESTTYTVDNMNGGGNYTITVDSGVTLNAGNISCNNTNGTRSLVVNGTFNVSNAVSMTYGSGETISGSGILNVGGNMSFQPMYGNSVNISVHQLNIAGGLSFNSYTWGGGVTNIHILDGTTTVKGAVNHTGTGYSGNDFASLNISGGSLVMEGGATMTKGWLKLSAGSLVQAGGTSNISNTVSMTGGELRVTGGAMNITSTAVTGTGGSISISGGELSLSSSATALLEGVSSFSLSGGTLGLSDIDFDTDTISLAAGATFSFGSEGVIALGNLQAGTVYQIFDTTTYGGTLTGWDALGLANFTLNGAALAPNRAEVTLGGDGTFSYNLLEVPVLTWVGGKTDGRWNTTDANWDTSPDQEAGNNVTFVNGDSVIFASEATLSVDSGVTADVVTITNNAQVTLNGQNLTANQVKIESGVLKGAYASVLAGVKAFSVEKDAQLDIHYDGTPSYTSEVSGEGAIRLYGGGTMIWNPTDGIFEIGMLQIEDDNTTFKTSSTFISNQMVMKNGIAEFTGTATIAALTLETGSKAKFTQATLGTTDNTITLAGGQLCLNLSGDQTSPLEATYQTVNSAIVVNKTGATAESPATSIIRNDSSGESMHRTLSSVTIAAHNTLELQQNNWNTIWQINDLSGEGNLVWNSTTNHNTTSRLILTGDGSDYAGTISFNRNCANISDNRTRQAYMEIASNDAVKGAVVELKGSNSSNVASLAINTANVTIQGLKSDGAHTYIYSGAAATNCGNTYAASTTANTLTIAGSGTYDFKGVVGQAGDAHHLNLAMTGCGSQTFSGAAYVGDVSVSNGTLALTHASSKVNGSITVSGGALSVTNSYTLGSGQTLSVLTSAADAVQLGGLTLTGGALVFDAGYLTADTAALKLNGTATYTVDTTQTLTLNFANGTLNNGTYKLASGDWLAVGEAPGWLNVVLSNPSYGSATVSGTADGLYLTFAAATNVYNWSVDGDSTWDTSSQNWDTGAGATAFTNSTQEAATHAVFDGVTSQVTLAESISVSSLSVLGGAQVSLSMGEGSALSTDHVIVENGRLELVSVGTEASHWNTLSHVTLGNDGVLALTLNACMSAAEITLRGGELELQNGNATGSTLDADIVVEGSGSIRGSYNGNASNITGKISGHGTLNFHAYNTQWNNVVNVAALIADGAEGALGLHVTNGTVKLTNTNTYTGGTVIDAAGKLTITSANALGGTNGVLGKVSGEGTLVLELGNNSTAIATGTGDTANVAGFTGTFDIVSGTLRIGATRGNEGNTNTTFNASDIIVRSNAALWSNFADSTFDTISDTDKLSSNLRLMSGATLKNIDGHPIFEGGIKFNVKDDGSYDSAGTVKIDQHWGKNLSFTGLLEGAGTVKLFNANQENNAEYYITGQDNTFAGTFQLVGDDGVNESRVIKLHLGSETAAQHATIDLAASTVQNFLMLDSNATIAGLKGVVDAQNAVQATGKYALTVSSGDFGGKLENGSGTLALTKQGNGTLTLRGANSYTGATTVKAGTLELAGAVGMNAASAITVVSGATLKLNATADTAMTLGNTISGAGTIHKLGSRETVLSGNVVANQITVTDPTGNTNTWDNNGNAGILTLTGEKVNAGTLYMGYGTINIGSTGQDSSTFMQIVRMETADSNAGGDANVNVNAGSTLTITGNNNDGTNHDSYSGYKNATIILGEWNKATNLSVSGTLLAKDAKALVGDNTANITIEDGGVMAVKGMGVANKKDYKTQAINVTLKDGGTLILGDGGVTTDKTFTAELGAGTVGMSANATTIEEDLKLMSAEGTIFDTTQYAFVVEDGVATGIQRGSTAGSMTISGNISSAEGVTARMKVTGNGTLHLNGAENNLAGGLEIAKGAGVSIASGKATLRSSGDAAATISGAVSISQTDGAVAIAGTNADAPALVDSSLISLAQGAGLSMTDVILTGCSRIAGEAEGPATLALNNTQVGLAIGNTTLGSTQAMTLNNLQTMSSTAGETPALSGNFQVLTLDSMALSNLSLSTGSSFTVDFSQVLAGQNLTCIDFLQLSFDNVSFDPASELTITGVVAGCNVDAYYQASAEATVANVGSVIYFDIRSVPEPTTSTLGLAALVALAARRRRKA